MKMPTADPARVPNAMVDSDTVLRVQGLSKKYCRDLKRSFLYGLADMAREATGLRAPQARLRTSEFWALDDVDLTMRRGRSVGLVGPNGSGKTTLLRLISGLLKPDRGRMEVHGLVAPLIALGPGLHPILTGRENIFVRLSLLGLRRREIEARFDEVVAFAEIGEAIDAPLRTYSSGMRARLGFSCAIQVRPDILLLDEVIAVGDARFRAKCHRTLAQMRDDGTTVVVVSHNPKNILATCTDAIYLKAGRIVATGPAADVLSRYERDQAPG